ncbi:MAG: four helix bundle protein [Candidatus Dojkabacteria bacterium]
MQDFKKLKIWTQSKELTISIYKVTKTFPREEIFGLTSQIRRASISIAGNIAEGSGRFTPKDFSNFVTIAIGSLSEVECYLIISQDLQYIDNDQFKLLDEQIDHLKRMLISFKSKLNT